MSDSVRPHTQQPTRLPHRWDSPGKNTGMGCHFLLQCMKVKTESEVARSCLTHLFFLSFLHGPDAQWFCPWPGRVSPPLRFPSASWACAFWELRMSFCLLWYTVPRAIFLGLWHVLWFSSFFFTRLLHAEYFSLIFFLSKLIVPRSKGFFFPPSSLRLFCVPP